MQINWFTVIAQVINFVVLVWLLKRFLYKPILNAIDEREKKIASRLDEAKTKKEEAEKEKEELKSKNENFDQQKKENLNAALASAKEQKNSLIEDARKEASAMRLNQEKALTETLEKTKKGLTQKIQKQVFDVSRKTLTDMASVSLEEKVTELFIARIEGLDAEKQKEFKETFTSGKENVVITSVFDLTKKLQKEIETSVDKLIGKDSTYEFKTSPDLISGIELSSNGYKLDWSISAYLDSLQDSFSETTDKKEASEKENVEQNKAADKK
jgi:F-type H+-transporting ATPase subunit b